MNSNSNNKYNSNNNYNDANYNHKTEQGLTSHQTQYRSYQGRVFMGKMTQPTVSEHWRKIGSKD